MRLENCFIFVILTNDRFKNLKSCLVILRKIKTDVIHNPVGDNGCSSNHDLPPCLTEALIVLKKCLNKTEISHDILVVLIVPDGHKIRFLCLSILLLPLEQNTLDVPASEIGDVLPESRLDNLHSLCFLF